MSAKTLSASEARASFYRLIDEAAASHEPILMTRKRSDAVLVSEDDWRAIEETLCLLSIPGMRESIVEGGATPVEECSDGRLLLPPQGWRKYLPEIQEKRPPDSRRPSVS